MPSLRYTEAQILNTEIMRHVYPDDDAETRRVDGNIQTVTQCRKTPQRKPVSPTEPISKMTGLEKSFLYFWRLCGGESDDWLFGQHPFTERKRMHLDFTLARNPKIAVEIDGGQWQKSGHSSGTGLKRDAEKLALCNQYGITLFRLPTSSVNYDEVMKIFVFVREKTQC